MMLVGGGLRITLVNLDFARGWGGGLTSVDICKKFAKKLPNLSFKNVHFFPAVVYVQKQAGTWFDFWAMVIAQITFRLHNAPYKQ